MNLVTNINSHSCERIIRDYISEYNASAISLPKWQRFDKWSPEFKRSLIVSILNGKDIPKLYLYSNPATGEKFILDGGHRTRCIAEFMGTEFSVQLNDGNWYQWEMPDQKKRTNAIGQTLQLPDALKEAFLEFNVNIVTYRDMEEQTAREIFNELNHQRPMTPSEVINSWSSALVDKLRELNTLEFMDTGVSYVDKLSSLIKNAKKDNHEFMKWLTSMFSVLREQNASSSVYYCEPRDALRFIQMDGSPNNKGEATSNIQFSSEELEPLWNIFMESLDAFIKFLENLKGEAKLRNWKPIVSEVYSIFEFFCTRTDESPSLKSLQDFIVNFHDYRMQSMDFNKILTEGSKHSKEILEEAKVGLDAVNASTSEKVIRWSKTVTYGGERNPNKSSALKSRKIILTSL